MTDPASWCKLDVEAWPLVVPLIHGEWPKVLVLQDLRWWVDRVRMGYETRPGSPALAERWGWTHWKVRQLLKAENPFDGLAPSPFNSASLPQASRKPPASLPQAGSPKGEVAPSGAASLPQASRKPPASLPPRARVTTEKQRTEDREDSDAWTRLAERWGSVSYTSTPEGMAAHKRTHRKPTDRRTGQGKELSSILRRLGEERAVRLIDWFESAPTAAFLRNAEVKRDLTTCRRHLDRYDELAEDWQGTRPKPTGKTWERPYSHPDDERLPESERRWVSWDELADIERARADERAARGRG